MAVTSRAADAPASRLFARKATGLVRQASAWDVFIYNTNFVNIAIGVTFIFLFVPAGAYPGSNVFLSILLTTLAVLPTMLAAKRGVIVASSLATGQGRRADQRGVVTQRGGHDGHGMVRHGPRVVVDEALHGRHDLRRRVHDSTAEYDHLRIIGVHAGDHRRAEVQ